MLKVKDNIDLKTLEMFGFVEGFFGFYRLNNGYSLNWNEFMVSKDNRVIYERFEPCGFFLVCVNYYNRYVQDLIKNDLVEKVSCNYGIEI